MAVPEQTPYKEYDGNGVTKTFTLEFICESKDHLNVTIDGVEPEISAWSFNANTNSVTFSVAPATDSKIVLQRNTPMSRTTNYQSTNNSMTPKALNADIDRVWLKLQELGLADVLLKLYVDRLHADQKTYIDDADSKLQTKINELRDYVDDQDDQLRAYLIEEIRKQGVALDQLDDYYNYLMQRLAQIAVDKGWEASFVVDASGKSQQEINNSRINRFPSVLDNPDVVGDGIADDTLAIQEYLTDTDVNLKSSVYFPFRNFNYLIQSHLILQEPAMIYGDKGATYNRGDGKKGNILVGASADYAFNLGNERIRDYSNDIQDIPNHISRNAADNWSVKNIGIKPAAGVADHVKTGIKHTAAHNGPDRGFLLSEVSGTQLKHVLHVTDQGQSVQLGTLVIENCCLSNNDIPVFAEGLVFGLRFTGNQCEQNLRGAIHGTFNAGVAIEDNMLEAQPNPIKLTIPPSGTKFQASIKRNYFEINTGEALIEVASSSNDNFLETGPNFFSRSGTAFPTHYLLLKGKLDAPRRPTVAFTVINKDPFPVSLYETATIKMDSDIFSKVNFFRQADGYSAGGVGGRVFTSKLSTFASRLTAKSGNAYGPTFASEVTELGTIRYSNITASPTYRAVSLAANTGDVLALNILLKLSHDAEGSIYIAVVNGGGAGTVTEMVVDINKDFIGNHGGMIMLTTVAKSLINVSSMSIGLTSQLTAGSGKFYGANIENFGQHAVGEVKDIYPSVPDVTYSTNAAQLTYDPPTLDADKSTTINVTLPGVAVGGVVQAAFSQYDPNIEISAAVSAAAIVTVKFKNIGSTSVNLGEGVLTVKSL